MTVDFYSNIKSIDTVSAYADPLENIIRAILVGMPVPQQVRFAKQVVTMVGTNRTRTMKSWHSFSLENPEGRREFLMEEADSILEATPEETKQETVKTEQPKKEQKTEAKATATNATKIDTTPLKNVASNVCPVCGKGHDGKPFNYPESLKMKDFQPWKESEVPALVGVVMCKNCRKTSKAKGDNILRQLNAQKKQEREFEQLAKESEELTQKASDIQTKLDGLEKGRSVMSKQLAADNPAFVSVDEQINKYKNELISINGKMEQLAKKIG